MKNTIDIDIRLALQNLKTGLGEAATQFHQWATIGEDLFNPSWVIQSCFFQLLAVAEALDLLEFRKMAYEEYIAIKSSKKAFIEADVDPDGEPYSVVISRVRCYVRALEKLFPGDKQTTVTKDLLQIIRDIHYVITDKAVFQSVPKNEKDVHVRIEAVLKCVFPDLKHKPVLTKQIKNFEPDTGIPSLQTLIEFKYLSRMADIGPIADQLLADTRGYISKDWSRYLYVIYETNRFRTEKDWNQLLRETGVPLNTMVVVLGGEPSITKRAVSKEKSKGKKAQQPHSDRRL